jgi:hypothetical protein
MKSLSTALVLVVLASMSSAQEKPRVFVQGKGSQNTTASGSSGGGNHWGVWNSNATVDSHDESMEVTKDLQKNCSGVVITLNQNNADYTVMLNRESKKNRGLLRSNSQVQVANKDGDVLGANATHTVGNAAKDACNLIVADWQSHAREQQDAAAPAQPAASQQNVSQSGRVTSVAYQPQSAPAASSQPEQPAPADNANANTSDSVADAARKAQQHQACLDLAKDNPSIVCK